MQTSEESREEAARLLPILRRYDDLLIRSGPPLCEPNPGTAPYHLRWMLLQLSEPAAGMTPLKMHRWLGFIQGTMIAHGLLTVPMERELTRQYLKGR